MSYDAPQRKSVVTLIREAAEEGYIQCICGDFAIGVHRECRALMTDAEYARWSERQDQLYARLFGVRLD